MPPEQNPQQRAPTRLDLPLVVFLVMLGLTVLGWLLARHFVESSRLEDCVMQGRRNCAPLDDPRPR